jgi:exopolysaccharide production protein ExoQ
MQSIALPLFVAFIAVVMWEDVRRRRNDGVSAASWIVFTWVVLVSSRPLSMWLQSGTAAGSAEAYLEGNPVDRAGFLVLIAAGLLVWARRWALVKKVASNSPWLFLFYAYCLCSVVWSDYPFVSFKRLFKDFGAVVMIFVLLTERKPIETIRAVFVRCAYLVIPLSLLFIRYYPDYGRALFGYQRTRQMYVGVATHKNTLGALVMVSIVFLVWDYLLARSRVEARSTRRGRFLHLVVLAMAVYLLTITDSATATACTVLAVSLLLLFRSLPPSSLRFVEVYAIAGISIWLLADWVFNITELLVSSLGRDMGLTNRTEAWDVLLNQDVSPIIGAGFKSFWSGARMERIWIDFPGIIQAHNGYINLYLEGGIIGLLLLAAVLLSALFKIKRLAVAGDDFALVRLTFWIIALLYNYSEASFTQIGLLWTLTLLVVTDGIRLPAARPVYAPLPKTVANPSLVPVRTRKPLPARATSTSRERL